MRAWEDMQRHADMLLCEGLWALRQVVPISGSAGGIPRCAGNYLISIRGQPLYAGEAADLARRLRQQFDRKRSQFYLRYMRRAGAGAAELAEFRCQHVPASLGRKELEEFAIVNASCHLNTMHAASRCRLPEAHGDGAWKAVQQMAVQALRDGVAIALGVRGEGWDTCRTERTPGVYIVRNGNAVIYVGESDTTTFGLIGQTTAFWRTS